MSDATKLLAPVWTHMTQVQPVRGEGIYLYDADGRRYTDFTSGIGVTNTGHSHPKVVQAIQEQASQLIFGQMNIVMPPATLRLAEELNAVTPAGIDQFFFSNSGAEAVEAASSWRAWPRSGATSSSSRAAFMAAPTRRWR